MSIPDDMTWADAAEFFYGLGMRLEIDMEKKDSAKPVAMTLQNTAGGWRVAPNEKDQGHKRERATARALLAQNELYSCLIPQIELLELRAEADRIHIEQLREQNEELQNRSETLSELVGKLEREADKKPKSRRARSR